MTLTSGALKSNQGRKSGRDEREETMQQNRTLTRLAVGVGLVVSSCVVSVVGAAENLTPKNRAVYVYAPFDHHLKDMGRSGADASRDSQHYSQWRTRIESTKTDSPSVKFSDFWNEIDDGIGWAHIESHGNANSFCVETYRTVSARHTAYTNYVAQGHIGRIQESTWTSTNDLYECIAISLYKSALGRFKDRDSLVVLAACHGLDVVGGFGARVGVSDKAAVLNSSQLKTMLGTFYKRMRGNEGDGKKRPVAKAIEGIHADLGFVGAGNAVLAPKVKDWFPKRYCADDCDGYVQFDSVMKTTVPASAVVTANVTLTDVKWVGDDKITFKIRNTTADASYTFRVHNDKAYSGNYVGSDVQLRLDGGIPNAHGQGPNEDDFTWTVTGSEGACDPAFVQADARNVASLLSRHAER